MSSENQKQDQPGPASSFLPVFIIGALVILGMQFFTDSSDDRMPPPSPRPADFDPGNYGDFVFPTGGRGDEITVETGYFVAKLNTKGGRISGMYIESHDQLKIPETVIATTGDPLAKKYQAIEITRGNGMDFQFHTYADSIYPGQLALPPLNDALFRLEGVDHDDRTGVHEVRFSLPLRFVRKQPRIDHRLELIKVFRFLPAENYFRQITVLRNLEREPFVYPGDMFYKPFGDLGPNPEVNDARTLSSFGRFFYYNGEIKHRSNYASGAGGACFPFGCSSTDRTGLYTWYDDAPNTLGLIGASSRYFFAYTEFLDEGANTLHVPDGLLYKNEKDLSGREAFTVFFRKPRLEAAGAPITSADLGSPGELTTAEGKLAAPESGNRAPIAKLQKNRTDAIIVDNKVYVGVRSDEAHRFHNPELVAAEFGVTEPNDDARGQIYTSSFLAIFSAIRDGIVVIMRWVYTYTGNYGWAIIIIAVGFKLITWPLNQMQAKSMKKMSALRPEMEELNEKYADDPQEKQKRMLEMYKKHNINPAKGCLPILIQMPVFIALYSAFSEAIELWKSPFILWMTDLSAPDTVAMIPYIGIDLNILPLAMVVSQLLQQHFTTVVTDPQQKMIMYFMPIMMIFIFWQMPSGVTLYWTVQNVIGIIWQVATNKLSKDEDVPAPAKA